MKNIPTSFLLILLFSMNTVYAQTPQDQVDLLINDMLLVAENFASPGAEGAALQSSAGWFSSAATLDKWGVQISVHGNALFVPKGKQNQLSSNRDFQILNFRDDDNALLPTVFGGQTSAVFEGEFAFDNPITGVSEAIPFDFNAIDGLDKAVIIHPFPQVTVGLPYSTEVAVRYLPSVMVNDVGFSTYGIGIKHNLSQYIERRYHPEDFQLAVAATYSNFKVDYAFEQLSIPLLLELNRIDVDADLWLLQVLGSKLYNTFEVFGGLGVTHSQFGYVMGGTGEGLPLLNAALTGLDSGGAKFKGDIGFNYYFDKFKISTMFTASNFFNANVGIHYAIR